MKHKSWLLGLILGLLLMAAPAYAYGPLHPHGYNLECGIPLTVHVDGKYVSTDVRPFAQSGRTYLPLRAACESMGASVQWNGANQTATITKGRLVIKCQVGSGKLLVNGTTQWMDAAPLARNNRILLPIRPISDALGANIVWDGESASVDIYTGAPVQPKPKLPDYVPNEVSWLIEKYYVADEGQGVGTWELINVPQFNSFDDCFLFISKMPNSNQRNAVKIFYKIDYSTGELMGLGVDTYPLTPTSNGFTLKDTWNPLYWYGGGIGSGPVYLIEDYVYDGDNIYQPGERLYFYNPENYPYEPNGKYRETGGYFSKI